jgi:hypothetical protein
VLLYAVGTVSYRDMSNAECAVILWAGRLESAELELRQEWIFLRPRGHSGSRSLPASYQTEADFFLARGKAAGT